MGSSRRGLRRYEGAITSAARAGSNAPQRNWEERQHSLARRTQATNQLCDALISVGLNHGDGCLSDSPKEATKTLCSPDSPHFPFRDNSASHVLAGPSCPCRPIHTREPATVRSFASCSCAVRPILPFYSHVAPPRIPRPRPAPVRKPPEARHERPLPNRRRRSIIPRR